MTRTFEEMCKARDPLYAAMQPAKWYAILRAMDIIKATNEQACNDLAFLIAGIQLHPEFVRLEAALQ